MKNLFYDNFPLKFNCVFRVLYTKNAAELFINGLCYVEHKCI